VHNKNKYSQKEINPTKKVTLHFLQKSKIFPIILFTLLTLLTSILIYFPHYVGIFLAFVIAATAFVLFYSSIKFDSKQRKIILILLLMMFFCMIFFANEFQVNNSLLIFSDKHVNRTVLGWKLPTNVLAALEPMFVVILAPLLSILWDFTARKNKTLSIFKKITIGMLLECFGFALLAWVIYLFAYNEKLLPLFWIILTCMLLGLGELFIMPTVIAAITRFASKELKGLLMGVLYLALALSGYLSGYIAMLTTQHFFWSASGVSLYTKTYIFVALIALIGSVVAFIISYFSHRITPLPGC
jgi:POT family proton-dependent oligopeptide transporter